MERTHKLKTRPSEDFFTYLGLRSGSYFTNTEPSHLCSYYLIQTGFYLPFGDNHFLLLESKDKTNSGDPSKIIHSAWLNLSLDAFDLEEFRDHWSFDRWMEHAHEVEEAIKYLRDYFSADANIISKLESIEMRIKELEALHEAQVGQPL